MGIIPFCAEISFLLKVEILMNIKKSILVVALLLNILLLCFALVDAERIVPTQAVAQASPQGKAEPPPVFHPAPTPVVSEWKSYLATAYALDGITRSGVWVRPGVVAVDPDVIPLGSLLEIRSGSYSGYYRAMDTGALVHGRHIDIYVPNASEARLYGRRRIQLRIVQTGDDSAVRIAEARPSSR